MKNGMIFPAFMRNRTLSERKERPGVTLIEMLVAATIMIVAILGMVALWAQMMRTTLTSDTRGSAYEVAKQVIERSRSLGFYQNLPYTVEHPVNSQGDVSQAVPTLARWRFFDQGLNEIVLQSPAVYDGVDSGTAKPNAPAGAVFCALTEISRTDPNTGHIPTDRPDLQILAIQVTVFDARKPADPALYAAQDALTMGGV